MIVRILLTALCLTILTALGACRSAEPMEGNGEPMVARTVVGTEQPYPNEVQAKPREDYGSKKIYTFLRELATGDLPKKQRFIVMLGPAPGAALGSWEITATDPGFILYNGFAYIYAAESGTDPQGKTEHGSAVGEGTIFILRRNESANVDTFYLLEGTKLAVTLPADLGQYDKSTSQYGRYLKVRYDDTSDPVSDWELIADNASEADVVRQIVQWAAKAGLRVPATPIE